MKQNQEMLDQNTRAGENLRAREEHLKEFGFTLIEKEIRLYRSKSWNYNLRLSSFISAKRSWIYVNTVWKHVFKSTQPNTATVRDEIFSAEESGIVTEGSKSNILWS